MLHQQQQLAWNAMVRVLSLPSPFFFVKYLFTRRATTVGIRGACRVSRLFLDTRHHPDRRLRVALRLHLLLRRLHPLRPPLPARLRLQDC